MFQWLYTLFGTIIRFIYFNCGENFGLALIIFTVLMKLIILPLGIKQQRSMQTMQKLQPQLNELQRKYAHDKEKLSRETMELYKKNNASPAGGCLPLIIQLLILLVMVQIVYRPGTYIMGIEGLGRDLTEQISAAQAQGMNFRFLWWDLAEKPVFTFNPTYAILLTWVLPLLATAATYLSGVASQKLSGQPASAAAGNEQAAQAQQMSKSMTTMMPIMTLIFTFTLPLSASLYWFISSITQVLQQWILTKILKIEIKDEGGKSYHEKLNEKRKKRG